MQERFAEFSFSMVSVEKNEMSESHCEQMMAQNMATFRNGMAGWLKVLFHRNKIMTFNATNSSTNHERFLMRV